METFFSFVDVIFSLVKTFFSLVKTFIAPLGRLLFLDLFLIFRVATKAF
jgi:hypothetical protein